MKDFQFSAEYIFVRGRQLEGTFPGDAATGIWPITGARISRGWGVPPEAAWPYDGRASAWPPSEPPGIDAVAKRYPGGRYQRVRTLLECKTVIALMGLPVGVSVEITDRWFNAPHGRIPAPSPGDTVIGTHYVLLADYDDDKAPANSLEPNARGRMKEIETLLAFGLDGMQIHVKDESGVRSNGGALAAQSVGKVWGNDKLPLRSHRHEL